MSNRRSGRMPDEAVELVEERSNGMCEARCGRRATEIHHRRYLSRGGRHNVANLVHLCGMGNHDNGFCHGVAHRGKQAPPGWSISAWDRRHESEIPFEDLAGRLWWFDDEGNKTQGRRRNDE